MAPTLTQSSGDVTLAIPQEALPAVLAIIELVRASTPSGNATPFADRLTLTVPETAKALGLGVGTVRSIIRRGELGTLSFGSSGSSGHATRILVRNLLQYLDQRADEVAIWEPPTPPANLRGSSHQPVQRSTSIPTRGGRP